MNYKKTVNFCILFLVISNLVVYLYSDNNNEKTEVMRKLNAHENALELHEFYPEKCKQKE